MIKNKDGEGGICEVLVFYSKPTTKGLWVLPEKVKLYHREYDD